MSVSITTRLGRGATASLVLAGASLLAISAGCKKSEPAPAASPPAAAAVAPPSAPGPIDVARAAELIAKYEKLADRACACESAECHAPIKASAQAQIAADKALKLNDADQATVRAALVRLYQCEPGATPAAAKDEAEAAAEPEAEEAEAVVAAAPAPAAPAEGAEAEEGEGEAAAVEEGEAEEGEAEEGEAEEGEAEAAEEGGGAQEAAEAEGQPAEGAAPTVAALTAPEAAPAAPATGREAWFNQVVTVPYGDELLDFVTKIGVTSVAQLWGQSRAAIAAKYPDATQPEIQDVRPHFSALLHETESTNDADKTVVLVAGFHQDQLFQLSLKLQKSEADMKDQLAEKLGREWDRVIDDGYQVKAYVWDLPGHIVKVREKGPYRTIVIADAARATAFAEADADAVQAEIANTKGLELMTRFPRNPNSRAALAKFNEALGLVEDYGHAHVNLCNLHWTAWGDMDAARRACKAALESGESDVRAEATLHLGLIANASGDTAAGRTLLAQAAAMEVQDGYAVARAKKHLAFMKGTANRSQFMSLLDDLVCAAAENDTERGERLMASLGANDDEIQAMANGLGISAEDLLARDKGRCVSRSGQTW